MAILIPCISFTFLLIASGAHKGQSDSISTESNKTVAEQTTEQVSKQAITLQTGSMPQSKKVSRGLTSRGEEGRYEQGLDISTENYDYASKDTTENTVNSEGVKAKMTEITPAKSVDSDKVQEIKPADATTKEANSSNNEESTKNGKFLLSIKNEDTAYKGAIISLNNNERDLVEHIVMGEAGNEDFEGKVLVAQCIRDAMVTDGLSPKEVWRDFQYTDNISKDPTNEVKKAVKYVFDQAGSAVQHRILYFYAPKIVKSCWHETQIFVIQHDGHRVFDRRES